MEIIRMTTRFWNLKGHGPISTTTIILKSKEGRFYCTIREGQIADITEIDVEDRSQIHEIPINQIRPRYTKDLTRAPDHLPPDCYIKRPSLLDYNPVIDNSKHLSRLVLAEARVCEVLKKAPHPNIAEYLGCLVVDGRIHGLCFRLYKITLGAYLQKHRLDRPDAQRMFDGIKAGVYHIHKLGLVHNDLHPDNIMLKDGQPVIIDFDCCTLRGEYPNKIGVGDYSLQDATSSQLQNDLYSLSMLKRLLLQGVEPEKRVQELKRAGRGFWFAMKVMQKLSSIRALFSVRRT